MDGLAIRPTFNARAGIIVDSGAVTRRIGAHVEVASILPMGKMAVRLGLWGTTRRYIAVG